MYRALHEAPFHCILAESRSVSYGAISLYALETYDRDSRSNAFGYTDTEHEEDIVEDPKCICLAVVVEQYFRLSLLGLLETLGHVSCFSFICIACFCSVLDFVFLEYYGITYIKALAA